MADDHNPPEPQNQPDPEPQAPTPPSTPDQEIPPVVEARVEKHDARLPPLKEAIEDKKVVDEEDTEMNRAIEEMCSRIKGEYETHEEINNERLRLRKTVEETEKKLAEAHVRIHELEEKNALVERQEELFAEEHRRHDAELQGLIEENRDLSKKQRELSKKRLELIREIMRKNFSKT